MKTIGKIVLRGLVVLLPLLVTIYIVWWMVSGAEATLGAFLKRRLPEGVYFPGMGIIVGLVLMFIVGLLTGLWVFNAVFRWAERQLSKIPLVKTLYGSMKDLMGFFPGAKDGKKKGMEHVVLVTVGGMRFIGMITREDFDDLPEGLRGEDEVLVYLPMSYQLGGFTVWVSRSATKHVELTVAEGMRFAMTGGMSTAEPSSQAPTEGGVQDNEPTRVTK